VNCCIYDDRSKVEKSPTEILFLESIRKTLRKRAEFRSKKRAHLDKRSCVAPTLFYSMIINF